MGIGAITSKSCHSEPRSMAVQVHYMKVDILAYVLFIPFCVLQNIWRLYVFSTMQMLLCNRSYFVFLFFCYIILCVRIHLWYTYLWISEDHLLESVLSFHLSGSKEWIHVVRLQGKYFYSMSYGIGPLVIFHNKKACVYLIKITFANVFNP